MKNKGFSLVELIVVIAIMAILVGVAVPVYTSYIEKAQKSSDKQLVDEIKHAVEIANAADPLEGTAAIVLKKDGAAEIVGGSAEAKNWLENAIVSTFGSLDELKLKYAEWGNGAAVSREAILYFASVQANDALYPIYNGTATPSFAENVDDLFVVIKDTASDVGNALQQSGASLVQGAADFTLNKENNTENFAKAWATQAWNPSILGSEATDYGANAGELTGEALSAAIANAAAIKARNTALAEYLAQKGFGDLYSAFADYTYGTSAVPKDAVGAIMTGDASDLETAILDKYTGSEDDFDDYMGRMLNEINTYYGLDEEGNSPTGEALKATKAYTDGLAYYALMSTVNTVNSDNADDDSYWEEMSSAVSMYGDIATGKVSLTELNGIYNALGDINGENAIVITFVATANGMDITVNPSSVLSE